MYRIESVLLVLALLPFAMAVLVRASVIEPRKDKMDKELKSSQTITIHGMSAEAHRDSAQAICTGLVQMKAELDSLYGVRFFVPAAVLSFLYLMGFSLALSCLLPVLPKEGMVGLLCRPFQVFRVGFLVNPAFAVIGSYVFHTGVIVRRSFMSDITKNVYWASVNRLIFSVGMAIAFYKFPGDGKTGTILSFAVAFFPGVAITGLRKYFRNTLGQAGPTVPELDLQLVQGIDIWKEDRLMEEGIESVQNLATANVFSLVAKMHYPVRTIVDWIDQAILIQRFPSLLPKIIEGGLPVSAIGLASMGSSDLVASMGSADLADQRFAKTIGAELGIDSLIMANAMQSMVSDGTVQLLWRLSQMLDTD